MRRTGRPGFTLVELLVVIAIMGILVALLLPALATARSLVRRLQCSNRMTGVGKALHAHATAFQTLPPGFPSCADPPEGDKTPWIIGNFEEGQRCSGPSPLAAILAQIEETLLYEALDTCMKDSTKLNATTDCLEGVLMDPSNPNDPNAWTYVGTRTPKVFICPAAEKMTDDQRLGEVETVYGIAASAEGGLSKGNYVVNWGSSTFDGYVNRRFAGAFQPVEVRGPRWNLLMVKKRWDTDRGRRNSKEALAMVGPSRIGSSKGTRLDPTGFVDGMSNTLMLTEIVGWNKYNDGRGVWAGVGMGMSSFTAQFGPNDERVDRMPFCDEEGSESSDRPCSEHRDDAKVWATARSRHRGGVMVVMADCSAQFISDTIDLVQVWKPMSTRDGNDAFEAPW